MRDYLHSLARAALVASGAIAWAFLFALLLTGCASGVRMSDDERASCRNDGCTPWTQDDLRQLVNKAAGEGYKAGWRDAVRQSGRDA